MRGGLNVPLLSKPSQYSFFSLILVDRPLVLLNVVGDPVNNTDVIAECTAQFYPGVPLEAVRIQWYNGDGNEVISNLPRVEVGSVEQLNDTHFIRLISLTPVILEDSDNYTCVAYAEGDLLFSSNSSATTEFIVERKSIIMVRFPHLCLAIALESVLIS